MPTYREQGLAIELDQWLGLLVPAGTPAVRERFAPQRLEAVGGSAEAFARLYRADYEKYARLVKELAITVN